MALTDAQLADTRRFLGYQVVGTTAPVNANQDLVYVTYGLTVMSLYTRLTSLSAVEEATLVNVYLTNLTQLESDIVGSRANLDTDSASVWKHNANEIDDRTALFNQTRRRLCAFLGVPPGPGLGDGGIRLMRG